MEISRIMLPIDFQDVSTPVIHEGAVLARHFHSEILILHVVTPLSYSAGMLEGTYVPSSLADLQAELLRQAQHNLDRLVLAECDGLPLKRSLVEGDPASTIVQTARDEKVGLIMMPTHGYKAFRRFLIGSVTSKVLHDSECPVWTGAHLEQTRGQVFGIRTVACAIDLRQHSRRTVQWAADFAAGFQAELTLIHILPGLERHGERIDERLLDFVRSDLEQLQNDLGTKATVIVQTGDVPTHLDRAATSAAADVLIIGRPLSGGLRATGYAIVRESHIPILSV